MNERLRISLAVVGFAVVAVAFVVLGIYGFGRMSNEALASSVDVSSSQLDVATPESVGLDSRRLTAIDTLIEEYISEGAFPGAVVGVVRDGKIVYRKSFGYREVVGDSVEMTLSTRFDLASLTKPVAVATSIMQLVERGKITLGDRVDSYIPGFRGWAEPKDDDAHKPTQADTVHIRIADLLTHTSGLPPYVMPKGIMAANPDAKLPNPDDVIEYIAQCDRWAVARTERIYSCLNYITLAHIVEVVTGQRIDSYAQANIFAPLGMSTTCYLPTSEYAAECAPTAKSGAGVCYRGVVHDPLARECMGGVSGNAGLFSTLDDLMTYAAMLLNGGSLNGAEILSKRGVEVMMSRPRGYEKFNRTLGWEHYDRCSQTGGDLLSRSTIGHTGATGTSIVIDSELDIAVIMLTNRAHISNERFPLELRSKLATVVGSAVRY
jgi:CubicO group peptidase (beta-lactamase class C family)